MGFCLNGQFDENREPAYSLADHYMNSVRAEKNFLHLYFHPSSLEHVPPRPVCVTAGLKSGRVQREHVPASACTCMFSRNNEKNKQNASVDTKQHRFHCVDYVRTASLLNKLMEI